MILGTWLHEDDNVRVTLKGSGVQFSGHVVGYNSSALQSTLKLGPRTPRGNVSMIIDASDIAAIEVLSR